MPSIIETALWAAAQRARESERTDHLFSDPLAHVLAGDEGMAALDLSHKYNPRHEDASKHISIPIRFFDDVAQQFTSAGIRQLVLLAAGMDARAYRLNWPEHTTIYRTRSSRVARKKETLLHQSGSEARCRRVTLGADLVQDWASLLAGAGFDRAQRSIWLIEGLFYYLEEPAVNHVLAEVSSQACTGSVLLTDLISRSFLTSPGMQPALKAMEERGMGWRFGSDDPVGLFAAHGWKADIRQPDDEGRKLDPQRFPTAAQPRNPQHPAATSSLLKELSWAPQG